MTASTLRFFGASMFVLSLPMLGFATWTMFEVFEWWFKPTTTTGSQALDWAVAPIVCLVAPLLIALTGPLAGCSLMAIAKEKEK